VSGRHANPETKPPHELLYAILPLLLNTQSPRTHTSIECIVSWSSTQSSANAGKRCAFQRQSCTGPVNEDPTSSQTIRTCCL